MSGLIKEYLLDMSLNRLPVDMKSDLAIAIQNVYKSGVFSIREFEYLDLYLAGYNAIEIAARYNTLTQSIESTLERLFIAIEEQSGYTDDGFIRRLEINRQHRLSGIRELKLLLMAHGKKFQNHDV